MVDREDLTLLEANLPLGEFVGSDGGLFRGSGLPVPGRQYGIATLELHLLDLAVLQLTEWVTGSFLLRIEP